MKKKEKKVLIYSTPNCFYCVKAKEFFAKNKIKYEEINVAADSRAKEEMVVKSKQLGVPVIEIDKKIIVGFDIEQLIEIFDL